MSGLVMAERVVAIHQDDVEHGRVWAKLDNGLALAIEPDELFLAVRVWPAPDPCMAAGRVLGLTDWRR